MSQASAAEIAMPPPLPRMISSQFAPKPATAHVATSAAILVAAMGLLVLSVWTFQTGAGPLGLGVQPPGGVSVVPTLPSSGTGTPVASATATASATESASSSGQPTATTSTPAPTPTPVLVPVLIGGIDSGPNNVCYPTVYGTATPNSLLVVTNGAGVPVQVRTTSAGTWRVGPLTGFNAGSRPIRAVDLGGTLSSAAARVSLTAPPVLEVSQSAGELVISVMGLAQQSVAITLDGAPLLTVTLDGNGRAEVHQVVALDGAEHTVTAHYAATCLTPENSIHLSS